MEARLKANLEILGQRRELVKHPFGSIKQSMNQGAFLMCGLERTVGFIDGAGPEVVGSDH